MTSIYTDQYNIVMSSPALNYSLFVSPDQSRPLQGPAAMDAVPESSIAQAAIAGVCILIYLTRSLSPEGPQWMRPFAKEEALLPELHIPTRPWSFWSFSLLALSVSGLFLTTLLTLSPPFTTARALELSPWVVVLLVTVIDRPRKTPKLLLTLFVAVFVCDLVSLAAQHREMGRVNAIYAVVVGVALASVLVILSMPMRDADLDLVGIAGSRSPPTSRLRSPEDNLTLWQFMTVSWMTPLISRGNGDKLNDEDVWLLPYDFQHQRLHVLFRDLKGSLVKRLVLANGLDLLIITFLGLIETAANLSNPVLLQRLLQSIQQGFDHKEGSFFYASSILLVRLVACQSGVFLLWFSRRAYERSRGEMLTAVYAKTLARKSFGLRTDLDEHHAENGVENGGENGAEPNEETPLLGGEPRKTRLARLLDLVKRRKNRNPEKAKAAPEQPATMGKILNLMRNDVYEVAQRFWEFPSIVTKPLQLVLSLALIWQLLGWPCLVGVTWTLVLQGLNAICVRALINVERHRRVAADVRLQATTQFVEAIRPLRWYDWQSKWLGNIMHARADELRLRIVSSLWTIGVGATNLAASALFPVFTFFAVTYIAGRPLPVDVAFPALQLFTMLESSLKELPALITVLLNASIAIGRLETFMTEPDKEEGEYNDTNPVIELRGASFAWPTNGKLVLNDLSLRFAPGLTVIHGKVGSGKTALLEAILGELNQTKGDSTLPYQMVGYCAQSPWLQNMSIRDNILFNFPLDRARYNEVLDGCELVPDLANFAHGDKSNIGENGIGLSGGQKARVALARAVYCQSRILLLDDPLAALDHQTAQSIVRKLFRGSLLTGRTVVLVTHRVDLCLSLADQVVEITDGRARVLHPDEYSQEIETLLTTQDTTTEDDVKEINEEQANAAVPDKFIEEENRASGGVVARVYWTYIKAGRISYWVAVIAIFSLFRFARIFNYWFLKAWGEAYGSLSVRPFESIPDIANGIFDGLPNPNDDVLPWLVWYAILGLLMTVLYVLTQCGLTVILYRAAKVLFGRVIKRVSNATFRFYDVTPVGRLMNRLTSDIGMLDGGVIQPLQNFAFWSLTWMSSMVVIALTTSMFSIFAVGMTIWFIVIFLQFLPTSQNLRRLEMVTLSPLMSNFGILVDGLATIRAFKAQPHFQNRNIVATDSFQKMDHFYWSLQAWLQYRYDILSASSIFTLTMMALYEDLSPGLTAFVLTSAAQLVESTHVLCKTYGQLQMDFVSVERVVELLDLEEEPNGNVHPPPNWPSSRDSITFDSVTIKYAPHLDPSLVNVSFTIPGGATCAVLGRTGSGKSTLALSLLATMHPTEGMIRVGSQDISKIDVHTWRQRISFVAQDPVLFPGTLRENLDPLEQHTDKECETALLRVLGPRWTLNSAVDVGGKNLSQGQRQLVGIGRAILRKSPIIILDEATASIDKKTAIAIQDLLLAELKDSTVITIAHRLEAVKDADYFIRLDAGRVIEAGPTGQPNGRG
ncbi:canalicular multispecific organic anion transporter 1 [Durotheca rogersii]|uniref:canalicular multispecific organic anion transporter 1 n=1 Tax=Durotheca rogersii TaxID=419775 RepID=UPI00222119E1|nr:canalicular multispecific organic anion transporter 1 [Durotheca rogersii]KAI5862081.1 canalicular multispecific organic anion transporter 1 [Durotheca rogersii]